MAAFHGRSDILPYDDRTLYHIKIAGDFRMLSFSDKCDIAKSDTKKDIEQILSNVNEKNMLNMTKNNHKR